MSRRGELSEKPWGWCGDPYEGKGLAFASGVGRRDGAEWTWWRSNGVRVALGRVRSSRGSGAWRGGVRLVEWIEDDCARSCVGLFRVRVDSCVRVFLGWSGEFKSFCRCFL